MKETKLGEVIGSILHGAYGDYYEQMLCLKQFRRSNPSARLILFFASESRRAELAVFDLSFADEIHPASSIPLVPVDRFFQFQVRDAELRSDVLSSLPPGVLRLIDLRRNLKPWTTLRTIDFGEPANQIGLSDIGRERLPDCYARNGLDPRVFERATIGFLWRYRRAGGAVSNRGQADADTLRKQKSICLARIADALDGHVIVAGMGVLTNEENRVRTDNKFSAERLDLPEGRATYLQGLSWGLELEIVQRCTLCIVMASGFSEALWIRRRGRATVLVDAPPHYVLKAIWNRMSFFELDSLSGIRFQLIQPHTPERLERFLRSRSLLPAKLGPSRASVGAGRLS